MVGIEQGFVSFPALLVVDAVLESLPAVLFLEQRAEAVLGEHREVPRGFQQEHAALPQIFWRQFRNPVGPTHVWQIPSGHSRQMPFIAEAVEAGYKFA